MLRAGICDLGTCDLEMGWPAGPGGPARWAAVRLVRPSTDGLVRPGKRDNWDTLARPRRPACAQQRVGQPAARSDRRAADLRRYLLVGDDLPHLRPLRYAVARRDAARFRPGAVAFPPGGAARFPRSTVAFPAGVRWR